jgi:hypothetical protein
MNEKRLPNGELAHVEEQKIRLYLLNLDHEQGRAKAKFFLNRGFVADKWETMQRALVTQGTTNHVVRTAESEFGVLHTIDCKCPTPDAKNPCIRTVWEVRPEDTRPRLITAHPID